MTQNQPLKTPYTMNTKICHISSVSNPLDGRIFFKYCHSLRNMGYQVIYISKFLETDLIIKSGIKWIPLSSPSNRAIRMLWVSFFQVLYHSLKTKACIYHFHDPELIPAMMVLKLFNKRVIYDIHENYEGSISQKSYIPNKRLRILISKAYSLIERLCIKVFDGVILARPDLAERTPDCKNKEIIHNFPIYRNFFKEKRNNLEAVTNIIYVGQIVRIRGILEMIQAFGLLEKHQLQLLGWFEDQHFEKECREQPEWKNVKYLGQCNADQVFNYINEADIGIVNFLPHPNHMTALANKPFEYMMCGLPMVLPDFPYWKAFFKDGAVYADPCNPTSIAESITRLSSDQNLMEEMGLKNAEKIKDNYNWELDFHKVPKLYESL